MASLSSSSLDSCKFEEKEIHLLKCAIQFFYRHIRFDESTVSRMSDNPVFQLFDEYAILVPYCVHLCM